MGGQLFHSSLEISVKREKTYKEIHYNKSALKDWSEKQKCDWKKYTFCHNLAEISYFLSFELQVYILR